MENFLREEDEQQISFAEQKVCLTIVLILSSAVIMCEIGLTQMIAQFLFLN